MADLLAENGEIQILCSVFPEEIWQKVLQNVHHPDDYTRIANSSPVFKNLWLLPHWNRAVFPRILELLDNSLRYHTPSGRSAILNLCLVCREWKQVVDNFLENLPEHFMLPQELSPIGQSHNDPRHKPRSVNQRALQRIQHVTEFRAKFDASHLPHQLNPFVGRELRIYLSLDSDNFADFAQSIINLFLDYGNHVWYFTLEVSAWNHQLHLPNFGVGEWIRDMILLLPSLRTLRFMVPSNFNGFTGIPEWQQRFGQMEEFWTQNQMPNLPNLTKLGEYGIPWPIFLALLRANPQVTILESQSLLIANNAGRVLETQVPKNLEKLCIFARNVGQLQILASAQIDWPLKMLSIEPKDSNIPWANLITVVNSKFGQTLRQLYVPVFDIPVLPLSLPNLEALHLTILNILPELYFLLPVASTLKTLYVEFVCGTPLLNDNDNDPGDQLCQIPHRSNLWPLMPRLQNFSVMLQPVFMNFCWYNCSRRQWEARQEDQNHAE